MPTRTTSPRATQRFSRAGAPSRRGRGSTSRSAPKGRRGGKAGGLALLAGAAGMAFRNRGRLMAMFGRRGEETGAPAEVNAAEAGTRPTTGAADPVRSGDIAPTDPGNRPDMLPPS